MPECCIQGRGRERWTGSSGPGIPSGRACDEAPLTAQEVLGRYGCLNNSPGDLFVGAPVFASS